jgi:alpha,alpha-trehalase
MLKFTGPAELYCELFEAVQVGGILKDSKTFVDAIPRRTPAEILQRFRNERAQNDFDLLRFVNDNFEVPLPATSGFVADPTRPVRQYIEELWDVLARDSDSPSDGT